MCTCAPPFCGGFARAHDFDYCCAPKREDSEPNQKQDGICAVSLFAFACTQTICRPNIPIFFSLSLCLLLLHFRFSLKAHWRVKVYARLITINCKNQGVIHISCFVRVPWHRTISPRSCRTRTMVGTANSISSTGITDIIECLFVPFQFC